MVTLVEANAPELVRASRRLFEEYAAGTLATMKAAIALYESLGFRRVEAYCRNPEREAVFMELDLRSMNAL